MIIKTFLTLELDEDDYPVPSDGNIEEEIRALILEYIYDIDGLHVKHLKLFME